MSDPVVMAHRRRILERDYPHIPLTPEQAADLEPHRVTLKPWQVWVEVRGAKKDKRGWSLDYVVRDDRPRLMRRNPHAVDVRDIRSRMDEFGVPRRVSEQDAAEAAEASHYTRSIAQAVANESEEVVSAEYQAELTKRAKRKQDEFNRMNRATDIANQDVARLHREIKDLARRAVKMGVDPALVLAPIIRTVQGQHENLRDAA